MKGTGKRSYLVLIAVLTVVMCLTMAFGTTAFADLTEDAQNLTGQTDQDPADDQKASAEDVTVADGVNAAANTSQDGVPPGSEDQTGSVSEDTQNTNPQQTEKDPDQGLTSETPEENSTLPEQPKNQLNDDINEDIKEEINDDVNEEINKDAVKEPVEKQESEEGEGSEIKEKNTSVESVNADTEENKDDEEKKDGTVLEEDAGTRDPDEENGEGTVNGDSKETEDGTGANTNKDNDSSNITEGGEQPTVVEKISKVDLTEAAEEANEGTANGAIDSSFDYSIIFTSGDRSTEVKGGQENSLSTILTCLGYEINSDTSIEVDQESVDTDVINVTETVNGYVLTDNGVFGRASKNLVVYVDGQRVEIEVVDPSEVSGSISVEALQKLFNGESGDQALNVQLTSDVTVTGGKNSTITLSSGEHYLYLSGYTLTCATADHLFTILSGATLNVYGGDPSKKKGNGSIVPSQSQEVATLFDVNGGILNIDADSFALQEGEEVLHIGLDTVETQPLPVSVGTDDATEDIVSHTYVLLTNITKNFTIKTIAIVTLNLNGYTLTAQDTSGAVITNNGTLILTDTSENGGGNVTGGAKAIEQNGTLTLSGKANVTGNTTANIYLSNENTAIEIDKSFSGTVGVTYNGDISCGSPLTITTSTLENLFTGTVNLDYVSKDQVLYWTNDYVGAANGKYVLKLGCPTAEVGEGSTKVIYGSVQDAVNAIRRRCDIEKKTVIGTVKMIADSAEKELAIKAVGDQETPLNITLDLNGNIFDASEKVTFYKSTLNLIDSAPKATHTGDKKFSSFTGGILTSSKSYISVDEDSCLNMYGGTIAKISSYYGAVKNAGTFTMIGGTITENTAKKNYSLYGNGGGVYNTGTFTMIGGTISGNTAKNNGGGVYNSGTMSVGGTAKITGNTNGSTVNNLYLTSGHTVTVGDGTDKATYTDKDGKTQNVPALSGDDTVIGVTTADTPSSGNPVAVTGDNSADYSAYFTSDNASYGVYNLGTESSQQVMIGNAKAVVVETGNVYDTVQLAVDAITSEATKKGTVRMIADSEENVNVAAGTDITLDLNGKTLTANDNTGAVITNSGTLTLTDSSTSGNGGNVTGGATGVVQSGTMTLTGKANISGNATGVLQNGTMTVGGTAKISDNTSANLYLPADKTVTVADGFSGKVGVTLLNNTGAVTSAGSADYSACFTSDNAAYSVYNTGTGNNQKVMIGIVKAVVVETGNVYDTVQAAITDAAAGQTVKMLANSQENLTIAAGKTLTLNLNGKVLEGVSTNTTTSVITVASGATLTLKDSNTGNESHNYKVDANGLWKLTDETATKNYEELTAIPAANDIIAVKGGAVTGGNVTSKGLIGGGVRVEGKFVLQSGNIIGNYSSGNGGGVFVQTGNGNDDSFVMSGGNIIGNASGNSGGGLFVYNGNAAMNGGTIGYNTSKDGGAVCVHDSGYKFTMTDGKITGNTATRGGGGIVLFNGTSFVMTGGTVSGNIAQGLGDDFSTKGHGGGLCMADSYSSSAVITGGTITGNSAAVNGGGVYYGSTGTLTVGSTAKITGNTISNGNTANNIYLPSDKTVTVETAEGKKLASGAMIGVSTQVKPTDTAPTKISSNGKDYAQYFFSDDASYVKSTKGTALYLGKVSYSANGAVVTAGSAEGYSLTTADNTLTIKAPEDTALTYDKTGKAASFKETSILGNTGLTQIAITYQKKLGEDSYDTATSDAPVKAGTYKASFTYGGATAYVEYTVRQKQLTASDPTVTTEKTYDGGTTAAVTVGSLTNKVETDTVTLAGTASYDNKNAGTCKTITVVYTISGADAGNYIKPVNKTYTTGKINQLQLTASNPTVTTEKTYDGGTTAALTVGSLNNKVETDTVTLTGTASYDNKNAGTGKTVTVVYEISGADAENYIKPANKTYTTGKINQLQLTVSDTTVTGKTYDGTKTATVTAGTLNGKVGTDDVSLSATAEYSDKNAGPDKIVKVTYTLGGTDKANYLTPVTDSSFTAAISPRQLTVIGTTADGKLYDGTTEAVVHAGTLSGAVECDDISFAVNTAEFADKNAENGKTVTVSYTLSGAEVSNYSISNSTTSADIEKRSVTMTSDDAEKTYDGTALAAETVTESGDGFIEGEGADYSDFSSLTNAGSADNSFSYALKAGTAAGNYDITTVYGTLTVLPKELTVEGTTVADKTYDGTVNAIISKLGELTGIVGTDSVEIDEATAEFEDSSIGSKKNVLVTYTLKGSDSGNYTVAAGSTTANINAIPAEPAKEVTPAKERLTIPVSTEDTVRVTATAQDGKAVVDEVPAEVIADLVSKAEEIRNVTVDLSESKQTITEAVLPVSLVKSVADESAKADKDLGLTVKVTTGSVTLDNTALNAVVEASARAKTVILVVEEIPEDTLNNTQTDAAEAKANETGAKIVTAVDSYILADTSRIEDLNGGALKLSLSAKVYEGYEATAITLWKIAEDGTMTEVEFETDEDGNLVFDSDNLGNFVILAK